MNPKPNLNEFRVSFVLNGEQRINIVLPNTPVSNIAGALTRSPDQNPDIAT